MKALRLLSFLAAMLWAGGASAASMYIAEFPVAVTITGSVQAQVAPQPATTTQKVAIGGASVSSAAFGATTHAIEVLCSVGCSVSVGTSPTATTSTMLLQQGVPYIFGVAPGAKIAVIANTDGNTSTGGGGGGTSSEFNAAFPTDGTAAGMKSGANMVPLTSTDGTSLDVKTIGTTTVSGTVTANLGTLNGAATAANQSTEITALGTINTTLGSPLQAGGNIGTVTAVTAITNALPAGTNAIGTVQPGNTANTTPWLWTHIPSSASGAGIAVVVSTALETGHVIKASAGNLYSATVTTTSAAGYLQVFNSTTVPSAGAVTPVASCYVPAFSSCTVGGWPPIYLSTGISVAFSASTTPFTKTDSATAMIYAQAQ